MFKQGRLRFGVACATTALLAATFGAASGTPASAAPSSTPKVKTVIVAGFGSKATFGDVSTGAEAYFNRVNASGELKGITIDYVGFTDDGSSTASALSAARQLVTQQHVFAIIDVSEFNPGSYLASQHVPYIGIPFDASYCSSRATASLWGFAYTGCLVTANPPRITDTYAPYALYTYAKSKTGSVHPTFLSFAGDSTSGETYGSLSGVAAKGDGFDVLSAKGNIPATVSDWTPYVEQWMTADHGKPPQVIDCLLTVQCIPAWTAMKAVGYSGIFYQELGNISLVASALAGTVTATRYNTAPSAALTQMQTAIDAVSPNDALSGLSNIPGYFSASMLVQALKKVGNDDTPKAVQKALATQTWQIKGLAGPTVYPASTENPTPSCIELLADNASGFTILTPFSCTDKTFKN
jgi:hypothetical protein